MKIDEAQLKIILDSRGDETLSAVLKTGNFEVTANVPAGKSRGSHEAYVLDPKAALQKFESVKTKILTVSPRIENQKTFDDFLIALDGTKDKSNLGGNLILALSLSWARLKAKTEGKELFEYLRGLCGWEIETSKFPYPIMNVINGGAHAQNKLEFQEFQIIPQAFTFAESFEIGKKFYGELETKLREKFGAENIALGDEAGFSVPFENNEEAIGTLFGLIKESNYVLRIGLDVAANHYFKDGVYILGHKEYGINELTGFYLDLIDRYNLISIEDPFAEEAFEDFANLKAKLDERMNPTLVITDDLTTTNKDRLGLAINRNSGNAIIIKPNQIGSLSETIEVAGMAIEAGWKTIVSHRSAETEDDFIADLAYAIGAWGIKAGAPAKPERLAKYERLLAISNKILTK